MRGLTGAAVLAVVSLLRQSASLALAKRLDVACAAADEFSFALGGEP